MANKIIVGIDEVGRGPLVGNVVAGAVILNQKKPIVGLQDSKTLSAKKRTLLFEVIKENAQAYAIGYASPQEIDELNILNASLLAMQRAYDNLNLAKPADLAMIDGNRCPNLPCKSQAIIKGDSKIAAISAASIIAKVVRDLEMHELDAQFPEYQFAKHKGYPTKIHLEALAKYGPTLHHRKSFAPVRRLIP